MAKGLHSTQKALRSILGMAKRKEKEKLLETLQVCLNGFYLFRFTVLKIKIRVSEVADY